MGLQNGATFQANSYIVLLLPTYRLPIMYKPVPPVSPFHSYGPVSLFHSYGPVSQLCLCPPFLSYRPVSPIPFLRASLPVSFLRACLPVPCSHLCLMCLVANSQCWSLWTPATQSASTTFLPRLPRQSLSCFTLLLSTRNICQSTHNSRSGGHTYSGQCWEIT